MNGQDRSDSRRRVACWLVALCDGPEVPRDNPNPPQKLLTATSSVKFAAAAASSPARPNKSAWKRRCPAITNKTASDRRGDDGQHHRGSAQGESSPLITMKVHRLVPWFAKTQNPGYVAGSCSDHPGPWRSQAAKMEGGPRLAPYRWLGVYLLSSRSQLRSPSGWTASGSAPALLQVVDYSSFLKKLSSTCFQDKGLFDDNAQSCSIVGAGRSAVVDRGQRRYGLTRRWNLHNGLAVLRFISTGRKSGLVPVGGDGIPAAGEAPA